MTLLLHVAKVQPEQREGPSSPHDSLLSSFPGLRHCSQTDANRPASPFEVAMKTFGSGTQRGMSKTVFRRYRDGGELGKQNQYPTSLSSSSSAGFAVPRRAPPCLITSNSTHLKTGRRYFKKYRYSN